MNGLLDLTLQPALGTTFSVEVGRVVDFPQDLLCPMEGGLTFEAIAAGAGTISLETPDGERRSIPVEVLERPRPLRAQDLCL